MAASSSSPTPEEDLISCANCLETEGYLRNPLLLPCTHVFCEGCLRKLQRDVSVIVCFSCKSETRTTVDQLPSAVKGPQTFCEPCKNDGETKMTAKVYCAQCNVKFCAKHEQLHGQLCSSHTLLGIKVFKRSAYADELRYCDVHRSEPYSIGCKKCWIVICPLCISSAGNCNNGSVHSYMSLLELSEYLTEALDPLKQKAEERFDELSALIKEITLFVSQWDSETQNAVESLNQTRKEQLEALNAKYDEMVSEYCESREKTKSEITGYIESKGGLQLTQLHERLKALQSDVSTKHLVDLVKGKQELEKSLREISDTEFSKVVLKEQKKLVKKDINHRELEVTLQSSPDITIGRDKITVGCRPKPTSITLIREVEISGYPTAVCQYKGLTYVGRTDGNVDRIDGEGKITPSVITIGKWITGIIAHDDRLYCLVRGAPYTIHVYDLTGRQLHTWSHDDRGNCSARALVVVNNELVVADRTNQTFTVYTLTGQQVRTIPCERINNHHLSVGLFNGNSLIVANVSATPELYKVSLTNGEIEWRVDKLTNPVGILRYGEDYALTTTVGQSTQLKVWILDVSTGEVAGSLTDTTTRLNSSVFDMMVDDDTLIVPRYNEKTVLFYKLEW